MSWNKWIFVGGTLSLVTWGLLQSSSLDTFVNSLDKRSGTAYEYVQPWVVSDPESKMTATSPNDEQLLATIMEEAEKRKEAPVDARLDRVWKAIPGYNGIEVDVEKTLSLAKQQRGEKEIPFVYKEVAPSVRLEDLGAQPIYKGNPKKPMAALMINVAWGNEFIGPMLDVLEREKVRATFFFDGSWLNKNIETAQVIQQKGHELSNHAYSHKNMSTLGREEMVKEIDRTQQLLKEKLGVDNTLFAPPSGDFNDLTVKVAHEMNLKTILWTVDTVDWMKPTSESIVRKIAARVEPGSMILMHPTASSSGALAGMIAEIKRKNLSLGTVSELISSDRAPKVETE
ncbi:hypothetical protein FE784_10785 [Paenibacillus hemerocallicola]|uniref:NodB homology domain-containing protein n=1 Tax=Paenibacillus hemerocallicola TaxID=1172614 RepID=A0A5C4TAS6_9BACL|nr:polysaccharide deacetylase family protein [Paenibacillus hemerocallicola]TNJ66158.1 hypothetical protein FE784_10785 [Paenibacillus hemerocallicola]